MLQSPYVCKEITNLVSYLKSQGIKPEYKEDIFDMHDNAVSSARSVAAGGDSVDTFFDEAVEIITSTGKASASLLQRRLSIGYARAARILDELEEKGIIGHAQGSKPREVFKAPTPPMPELHEEFEPPSISEF